jgi:hypothetical protein
MSVNIPLRAAQKGGTVTYKIKIKKKRQRREEEREKKSCCYRRNKSLLAYITEMFCFIWLPVLHE